MKSMTKTRKRNPIKKNKDDCALSVRILGFVRRALYGRPLLTSHCGQRIVAA